MSHLLEKQIQSAILDYLLFRGFFVWKQNNAGIRKPNGSYIPSGMIGIADIIGVGPGGCFLAVEVKRPGGRITPAQKDFLDRIQAKGGIALVAYSIDDIIKAIEEWQKKNPSS